MQTTRTGMEKNAVFIVVHLVSPSKVLLGLNNMFSKNKQSQSGVAYCVLAVLGFPIGFAPHCQEALLKTWYHVDVEPATSFEAGLSLFPMCSLPQTRKGRVIFCFKVILIKRIWWPLRLAAMGSYCWKLSRRKSVHSHRKKRLVDTQINGLQTTS